MSPSTHESSLSAASTEKKAPISIIPSRPMFTTPRALGEHAADRGEDQRRRVAEHRGEERRPDDDRLELAERGERREVGHRESEDAGREREAAEAALAAGDNHRAEQGGEQATSRLHHQDRAETGGSAIQAPSQAEADTGPRDEARSARLDPAVSREKSVGRTAGSGWVVLMPVSPVRAGGGRGA